MEGCDGWAVSSPSNGTAAGAPGELTFRRYERFGAGGAGLIWVEAIAVVPEGRANPRQLWINEQSLPAIKAMVQRTRRAAAASMGAGHHPVLVAQLTHSGRYSKPEAAPCPISA